jgi:hypothetical protein
LYLRAWAKKAEETYKKCFLPDRAGRMLSDLLSAFDDEEEEREEGEMVKNRELNDVYQIHNPRFPKEPSQPKSVSQTYFNRAFHPYDWYVQANTEVCHTRSL